MQCDLLLIALSALKPKVHFMANYIVTTSYTSTIGNGLDLPASGDFAYVGPGVMLGSALIDGRGIFASNAGISVQIAGSVFGRIGVEFGIFSGNVTVVQSGSVFAEFVAVAFQQSGIVSTAGAISGYYGITSGADIQITNSGMISGEFNGINAGGDLVLVNTGVISGSNLAVFVSANARITNLGTVSGGIITGNSMDVILNQGAVTGNVSTGFGDDLVDTTGGRIFGYVNLELGNDTYIGGAFADQVLGGAGQDDLTGAGGDDRFYARDADGNDDIDGGIGIDFYDASLLSLAVNVNLTTGLARSGGTTDELTGIERVWGGTGNDSLSGDKLANTLSGNNGDDTLIGNAGADRLLGGIGNDSLSGGDGNDRLVGNEGRDALSGGAGDDVLNGGLDVDAMTGGTGADRFLWADYEDFIAVSGGIDRITDFVAGQDTIDLSAIDALAAVGNQAFTFVGAVPATDFGQISIRTTANATFVGITLNSITAFEVIRLDGVIALTEADFVL
jgi:Ca2+-binding RTX toxin-like protein